MRNLCLSLFLIAFSTTAIFAQTLRVPLLYEDFEGFAPELLSSVVGAHTEYHYLPESAPKGAWSISTFRSNMDSQRAWRIIKVDGEAALQQAYTNKYTYFHPMIIAGDPAWSDYVLTTSFTPERDEKQSGVVFRYRNDRCYYFFGVNGQSAILKMVQHATAFHNPFEKILAEQNFTWTPGDTLKVKVSVQGNQIQAHLNDTVKLACIDDTYPNGKVGLMSDIPTVFHDVSVMTSIPTKEAIEKEIQAREAEAAALQAANPKMKLYKKIDCKDFGMSRNLRFGDLDGDGEIDVLFGQVLHHGPKDRNSELSCLTAMTLDGKLLWQRGEADPWKTHLTNDVGFQIHDLDNDGRNEVIYCQNMEIIVADGATGETKYSAPTPEMPDYVEAPYNKFPRILGDSLYFCDLRGTGHDSDIIIKDRYTTIWALNDQLEVMWSGQCVTGHYPFAYDIDGDGKDELAQGYTLFDDDGTKLWSLDGPVKDHADGVAIVKFREDEAPKIFCAASDEGMFMADLEGTILKHHWIGHVQNPAIADFRPDLPGLEALTINFWGNQGIVHFYDADGNIYHDFEPCQHGSMCMPVNWSGKPGEFWVLSPNVEHGGLYDGWGRKVVTFPADGHPDRCYIVLDVVHDAREEIIVWDPFELWVYTQDDAPLAGDVNASTKNHPYNVSNYMTSVSIPE